MTWHPQSYVGKVPMTRTDMKPNPASDYQGRTYWFYIGEVVYTFRDGLSYSKFKYHLIRAPRSIYIPTEEVSKCKFVIVVQKSHQNVAFDIHLKVENTGIGDTKNKYIPP